ncbi:MAG: M43 family zinc metalloprotease [Chitinophagales bacterium]
MKNLYLLMLLLAATTISYAQTFQKRCGTYDVMQYRNQQQPGYLDRVNAAFDYAKQIAAANTASRAIGDTTYRIQVVFHVVYTTPTENIDDSIIYSQIEVLNEDYRRLNADTFKTRDVFKPIAGDAHIEFYLATTDPDGNPTTGITHTQGNPGVLGFNPFQDNVKLAAEGIAAWPTDRYLNVWVCNILNGLGVLGYAFPPDNAPNWPAGSSTDSALQGVVLHYPCVGRNYPQPIDLTVAGGRSATHEIGHYLGLRHIWGDTTGCNKQDGDGISDTPKHSDAHQQTCDTSQNSCVDSPIDYPDMIENYMDYSDDRCLNMFTVEQISVMHAMLQTSRKGIAQVVVETGVENVAEEFGKVYLYPNPTTGIVQFSTYLKTGKDYSYEVLNAMGQRITAEGSINQLTKVLDLSNQPSGIYFIRFTSGNNSLVRKFQINR